MACQCILVVEDDQAIRETLKTAIELEGYHVVTAENGLDAIKMLPKLKTPCLILLDLMMPVMNGWEFAEALNKDQSLMLIPVVVVTAFTNKDKTIPSAKKVLKKPLDITALLDTVQEFCGPVELTAAI